MRRVAVFFSRLSGYMAACLRTLERLHDVELMIVRYPVDSNAPFKGDMFSAFERLHDRRRLNQNDLKRLLDEFGPEGLYISGWFDSEYVAAAKYARQRGIPVIAGLDGQWCGSFRQQLGRSIARWHLHAAIDVIWAAGERQRQFAAKLGYKGHRCWSGVYACDWDVFAERFNARSTFPSNSHFL